MVARHNGIVEAKGSTPLCSTRNSTAKAVLFFNEIRPCGRVKSAARVKSPAAVKSRFAGWRTDFISPRAQRTISSKVSAFDFTFCRKAKDFTLSRGFESIYQNEKSIFFIPHRYKKGRVELGEGVNEAPAGPKGRTLTEPAGKRRLSPPPPQVPYSNPCLKGSDSGKEFFIAICNSVVSHNPIKIPRCAGRPDAICSAKGLSIGH